jgi:hypothetical protein
MKKRLGIVFLLAAATTLWGQAVTGTILGTVKDPSDAADPDRHEAEFLSTSHRGTEVTENP